MNLVAFNMANVFDWQKGIVNRNFFIVRELLRSHQFEQVLLVDFLAVRSVKRYFGFRRTFRYLADCLGPLPGKKRIGRRHVLWDGRALFGTDKEVLVLSGMGMSRRADKDKAMIKQIRAEHGFSLNNTCVWSYNAFLPEALDMPAQKRVFDAVDDWSLHASYKREGDLLRQNYAQINQSAQTIFTVSEGLLSRFDSKKSYWIPNGVDIDLFKHSTTNTPPDIAGISHPMIGYVGTVQERIDFDLLRTVCQQHANASFVFIGPVWKGVSKQADALCRACPNVRFLGRRAYDQIPAYLAAMDVAMIPHRLDDFIGTTNPMKMYDYLAAGKAVVSTPGAGTEQFASYMYIADTAELFSQAITQALTEDSAERQEQRKMVVEAHTWASRAREMLKRLSALN